MDLLGSNIGMDATLAQDYFDTVVLASTDASTSVRKVTGHETFGLACLSTTCLPQQVAGS